MTHDPRRDRLDTLLLTEATQRLSTAEARELESLLADYPNADRDLYALPAAVADRIISGPGEPMPAHLAGILQRSAAAYMPAPPSPSTLKSAANQRPAWVVWSGWAAAAVLAAILLYVVWPKPKLPVLTPDQRYELVRTQPGTKQFAGKDKAGVALGEVVWNAEKQEGFIKVSGLPVLDPSREQYQLWIVDPAQKHPIDGGLFDVSPDGTALIPVKAALKVKDAQAFAVTRERAGGVVVTEKTIPEMTLVMGLKKDA